MSKKIPRSNDNDYSLDIVQQRQAFIEENTPAQLDHTRQFSFDPEVMSGNMPIVSLPEPEPHSGAPVTKP